MKKKRQGGKKNFVKKQITFLNYKETLFDEEKNQMRTMNNFRSKENEIYSMKINNDDKIITAKDEVHTFALRI